MVIIISKVFAYARISSKSESLARQIKELKKYGYDELIEEVQNGKNIAGKLLFKDLIDNRLREGDVLVVVELSRLGRNYDEIIKVINDLKDKKVQLVVTSLQITTEIKRDNLMSKIVNDLIIQLLVGIAENEREQTKRRQAQGIEIAKQNNVYKGKPAEYSASARSKQKRIVYHNVVSQLNNGVSVSQIAKDNSITRQTVYSIKKRAERASILHRELNY